MFGSVFCLFNRAQPCSFQGTTHPLPSPVSSLTRRGLNGRLVMAPFLSPGDNKPIWMHAEEREESKVALWAGLGGCPEKDGEAGGVWTRGALLFPPLLTILSPRISAGIAPLMGNMAAGTRPVK